jgi:hypothetical protein
MGGMTDAINTPPAPLFRDPIYDGAADPTIIWNRDEEAWWLVYTNRRASVGGPGFAWLHGTDIGVASSKDGRKWLYRGTLQGLAFEPGRNTFWAPEVFWHIDRYHMYVSYVPGIPNDWSGTRHIVHMTSTNLWDWRFECRLALSSDRVIDACVFRMPAGQWRMWYKDEANQSFTYAADSNDLYHWDAVGPVITDCAHEGPNVFQFGGHYWMITDPWAGIGVYRSSNCEHWERRQTILEGKGIRPDDCNRADHADVLVQGNRAYIFYFTHPYPLAKRYSFDEIIPYDERRTSLQVAELRVVDDELVCDRDAPFEMNLRPAVF